MVIIAPAMLFIVLLIVQTVLYFHAKAVVEQAAQEGAAAARQFDGSAGQARARALRYLDALGDGSLRGRSVSVQRTPEMARVTVSGTAVSLVPLLEWRIEESATGPVERYEPPQGPGQ